MQVQYQRDIKRPPYLAGLSGEIKDLTARDALRLIREGYAVAWAKPWAPPPEPVEQPVNIPSPIEDDLVEFGDESYG